MEFNYEDKKHGNKVKIIAVIIVAASASIIFGILLAVYYKRRKMTNFKGNNNIPDLSIFLITSLQQFPCKSY